MQGRNVCNAVLCNGGRKPDCDGNEILEECWSRSWEVNGGID